MSVAEIQINYKINQKRGGKAEEREGAPLNQDCLRHLVISAL